MKAAKNVVDARRGGGQNGQERRRGSAGQFMCFVFLKCEWNRWWALRAVGWRWLRVRSGKNFDNVWSGFRCSVDSGGDVGL